MRKKKKWHEGIDLVASRGKPVYTTAEGVVTDVGYNKGYGNYLKISHWKNIQTLYAHLEISLMHIGDRVKQGQIIGLIGASGKATGPHLHYELWYKGDRIDPIVFWRHIFNANKI